MTIRRVCVFCGSRSGVRSAYVEAARALGTLLATRGIGLVYGGASVGLMGAIADAALAAGGEVIGVIPKTLVAREVSHGGLSELHVVDSMHERKAMMAARSDAFIAMPGGLGTLEELFEVATWGMLGLHHKPIGLLDVEAYWSSLVDWLHRAAEEGFVDKAHLALFRRAATPDLLLDRLMTIG